MATNSATDWNQLAEAIEKAVMHACLWLRDVPNDVLTARAYEGNWSVKECIGHLINSATHNHHRFVWLQINKEMRLPVYSEENDAWVSVPDYQDASWETLLGFFRAYHLHLAHIIRNVNTDCLQNKWVIDANTAFTLDHLMTDYLSHLNGHLEEIKERLGV